MARKKWSIEKYRSADEDGKSDQSYQLTLGCIQSPGQSIDELSFDELIRLHKFIHSYVIKEQKAKQ